MTAKEWAAELDRRLYAEFDHWLEAKAVDAIAEAIEQAVAEEREANAKLLDKESMHGDMLYRRTMIHAAERVRAGGVK